jgi:phosphoribosylanthranilate isomerase
MNYRTRIKICGLTRAEDVKAAVHSGVDAIGFVFYQKSPRYIAPDVAAHLLSLVPPFVTTVGLFVNESVDEMKKILREAKVDLLQFHGDELSSECEIISNIVERPYIRAMRVQSDMVTEDLIKYHQDYSKAQGLLCDAWVDGYGGGGQAFDWSLIPEKLSSQIILSGGLNPGNVHQAVSTVRPYAVDVSSGVEHSKGIKSAELIAQFVAQVRLADETLFMKK